MTIEPPAIAWRERDGRLLRLRLARPKANVLDTAMTASLQEALTANGHDPSLVAILLDSAGPHFSFGASVEEHLPSACTAMLQGFHALFLAVLASEIPVLAVIRGQCLGGGLELAMAAHLLFAAPDTKLGQPEIRLGVFAPAASCVLAERVPRAIAEDLLISGRTIEAAEAHHLGLINVVAEDPESAALTYFDTHLAPLSPSSLRYALRAARGDLIARVRSRLDEVERLYLDGLMKTSDATEGLEAFLAKRQPRWQAR